MTQLVLGILASAVVFVTSGSAFGAVRRRKAISDLIDVREKLHDGDEAWKAKIDSLIGNEISALEALGDTTTRRRLWLLRSGLVLTVVALVGANLTTFLPGAQGDTVAKYIAAAACFVATTVFFALANDLLEPLTSRRGKIVAFIVPALTIMVGLIITLLLLQGTPYYDETLMN